MFLKMSSIVVGIVIFIVIMFTIDYYFFYVINKTYFSTNNKKSKTFSIAYWFFLSTFGLCIIGFFLKLKLFSYPYIRIFFTCLIFAISLLKILSSFLFLCIHFLAFINRNSKIFCLKNVKHYPERQKFLIQTSLTISTIPLLICYSNALKNAYDYQIIRVKLVIHRLPKNLKGLKIIQISDIHAGTLWDKKGVMNGIFKILAEKPDIIFFTGDLVNDFAEEMNEWIATFSKLKAPLGVFSVLGNHDYGDYVNWKNLDEKEKNFKKIKKIHEILGWKLLNNTNHCIEIGSDCLYIIGVENYSAKSSYSKYGNLNKALKHTKPNSVKLLLSHDPSHWKEQVIHTDVDVTFSGHTHGMQFGLENRFIKWSPVQYIYSEWAGLYHYNDKKLYVNRGFGCIGFPGRIGILPEITVFELDN
jgi:predicted MPP superfamily phosphohydrolase